MKNVGRPGQVVLSNRENVKNVKRTKNTTIDPQLKHQHSTTKECHEKKKVKIRMKKNQKGRNASLGRDNLGVDEVSTDSDSSDHEVQERERVITINCGPTGELDDLGFELMGGRTYDDDDYDDSSIYVQDVIEGHDVSSAIEAGDQILKIAGHSVLDVPLHHALNLLRSGNNRIVINILKHPDNLLGPNLPEDSDDSGPAESGQDIEDDFDSEPEDINIEHGLQSGLFMANMFAINLESNPGSKTNSLQRQNVALNPGSKTGSLQRQIFKSNPASRAGSMQRITKGSNPGSKSNSLQRQIVGFDKLWEQSNPGSTMGSLQQMNMGSSPGSITGSLPREAIGSNPGSIHGSIMGSINGSVAGSINGSKEIKTGSKQGSKAGSKQGSLLSLPKSSNPQNSTAVDETDGGDEVEVGFFSGRPGQLDDLDFEFAGGRDYPFVPRNGGIFITKVKFGSVLEEQISPGDKIIKLEGVDVTNKPQYTFVNLIRASHGKATMTVRKANKQQINASVFQDDLEVCVNALGVQDELIIEIKTGPRGRRGNVGFKITGGRDKPCKPGDPGVFVKAVKPGTKLDKILKPGDKLLKVDGKNVTQATQSQVMDLIRKADTRVLLHIKRPSVNEDEERKMKKSISEVFDADQVNDFFDAFELYCSPVDRRIKTSDLRRICRALGFNLTDQDIEAMVAKQDDRDEASKRISFQEFLHMISEFSVYLQKDADILEAFEIFDRERLGFFPLDDLKLAFQSMPGYSSISDLEMDEIMQIADSNNDGKVYYQDFKDLVLPIFHKY